LARPRSPAVWTARYPACWNSCIPSCRASLLNLETRPAVTACMGGAVMMPSDGLAALKIDRSRRRRRVFSETAFEFRVTPQILATATIISLAMGFAGGVVPVIQAARMKVVDALRRV